MRKGKDMKRISRELTPEEYKAEIKKILAYFHDFCYSKGLIYYMAYGSLIGAVRHQGFIPWDDDVDVYMMRKDYERFMSLLAELDDEFYVLASTTSPYYYNNFARLCCKSCSLKLKGAEAIDNLGAFIDIFSLDNVPLDQNERDSFYKDLGKAKEDIMYSLPIRYYLSCNYKRIIKYLFNIPRRVRCRYLTGTKKLKEKRDQLCVKYKDHDVGLYADLFDSPSDALLVKRNEIKEYSEQKFEDITVNVPKGYDPLLRRYYGDYMILPEEDQRVTQHHFIPYWK